MKINLPTVGPIVGFTGQDHTRLFIRGELERDTQGFRRCFGVVRWRKPGTKKWSAPLFNKLSPNFDMTGVFALQGLTASTVYEYQAGWFFADADLENIEKIDEGLLMWPEQDADFPMTFKTSTAATTGSRNYIVGSCRYLLRLFGGIWYDDRGDKVFRSVLKQIDNNRPVDALLMIGDQIYADDLNFVGPDTRLDQFLERYRTVFSQTYIQHLMARVPTYMILDDHEIEDNWPANADKQDRVTLYPHAVHAYQIYQSSHSPLFTADSQGRIEGTLSHFWYTFVDGCSKWFVMDSRTERDLQSTPRRMVSDTQLNALLDWLDVKDDLVKFVVTSVPLFPDLLNDADDKWGAFSDQRRQIIEHIRNNKIKKVVFVSGDVHCSFVSKLTLDTDPDFLVHSIISSSFFWPYPHMSANEFAFDANLSGTTDRNYVTHLLSGVYSDDNFARFESSLKGVDVSFFERKGDLLGKTTKIKF
ncbi:alkaline phosphatase D family protein [Pseudomonas frederiksbergensis]|uniref:alkaline phosphatase D family protein n=1 Tax=Pseudomonas frederiksbergensis TaxID=104087 RepID=UPI003D069628